MKDFLITDKLLFGLKAQVLSPVTLIEHSDGPTKHLIFLEQSWDLKQLSLCRCEIEATLERLKKLERDLSFKEQELKERERRLKMWEQKLTEQSNTPVSVPDGLPVPHSEGCGWAWQHGNSPPSHPPHTATTSLSA